MAKLIYGLCDMQSFYASCEVASREEYAARRKEFDETTDPALVVAGDPARRSGIILAVTPTAKKYGVSNAMRLGEALRLNPRLIVVRPQMGFYLEVSVRIQEVMRQVFPLQERFEAMRLVLPEHRSAMAGWNRQRSKQGCPTLSDDEFEQMWYTVTEAIENDKRVRVTLFGEYGNTVLEGKPHAENGRLMVHTAESAKRVVTERLLRIEML